MQLTEYYTPTHIYFGQDTELLTGKLIKERGFSNVLIHYGSKSAEASGLLGKVRISLKENNINFMELGGVKPNPRLSLVRQGIELCKKNHIDFILSVGGGSALDSSKAIAYGAVYEGDVWDFYCGKAVQKSRLPFGAIITLAATGSEMSDSSVITNDEVTPVFKAGTNNDLGRPDFAILNPELTYTVSKYQTGCGSTDIIMHTLERFFHNGPDLDLTDRIAASVITTVIDNTPVALQDPCNYDARANLLWAGSLSHNGLTNQGYTNKGDWACHKMEHQLSGLFEVAHGAGLAAIWGSWARYVVSTDPSRFAKLGRLVFGIHSQDNQEAAAKTIKAMEEVFRSFGMPLSLTQLGIPTDDATLLGIANMVTANGTKIVGGFKPLAREDVMAIYQAAV